ncbi:MAG: hypothetical protein ACLFU1_03180 [Alphaproteobacteria bacterium]
MFQTLELQKPLEDYVELLGSMTARSLSLFDSVLDPAFVFEDPYHRTKGVDAFKSLMMERFNLYKRGAAGKSLLRYRVHDFVWGRREGVAYVYWSMICSVHNNGSLSIVGKNTKGKSLSFDGMSEVCVLNNKQVISHRDFWGAHEGFHVGAYKKF